MKATSTMEAASAAKSAVEATSAPTASAHAAALSGGENSQHQ
jgi:hypothetical protein